jgi:hypothetical protein
MTTERKLIPLKIKPLVWQWVEARTIISKFIGLQFSITFMFGNLCETKFVLNTKNPADYGLPKTFSNLIEAQEFAEELKQKIYREQLIEK